MKPATRTVILLFSLAVGPVWAKEPLSRPAGALATGLNRGLAIVQKAAANYPKHRNCFSCHHQTLPMLAMATARRHRLAVDDKLLQAQADFTHQSFEKDKADLQKGRGIGGKGMTVGYGLWALRLAGWKSDETTQAMATYLLKTQHKEGYWTGQVRRPPLEESYFTATVLAIQGLQCYASAAQHGAMQAAVARAKTWLTTAPVNNQEDIVFRLWGMHVLDGKQDELRFARRAALAAQHQDGGWAQAKGMTSDAYATGQTLFVLQATGLRVTDPAYRRGVQFLLKTQCPDGSWLVKTRSKPIQTYFDNGDPHGKDQFISTPGTAWAVAALAAVN